MDNKLSKQTELKLGLNRFNIFDRLLFNFFGGKHIYQGYYNLTILTRVKLQFTIKF
jgi:hypothetical protein